MLDTLRASATGIFAKILLGLLVLMFGIWGIGDVLRNPSGKLTLASVGSETITANDYMRAMRREEENIRRIMGDGYSPEVLKDPALMHHVLQQLVNHALLKQESENLGLIPSDEDVVRRIRANPAFADDKGNFDKTRFDMALKSGNVSEKKYVEQMRQDIGINLLVDSLTAVMPVTDIEAKTLVDAREESRDVSLYALKAGAVAALPAPDTNQAKTYYDNHKREFTAPEYRSVSYVTLNANLAGKDGKVSEEELKALYKEQKDDFRHPEKRTVEQLLYSSKEAADKANAMLKGGKSFAQVAKETEILNKDSISLGNVERSNVIESAAEKVFTLQAGQTTDPIQSPFGWHIFQVTAIDPAGISGFEEARPTLERELATHSSDEALNKLSNSFQDALAGGATMAEAARDSNLKVMQAGPFDAKGKTQDGKPAVVPDLDKFLEVAFKTDDNAESSMTAAKDGTYYILHVDKTTPEHLRPMEEVRDQVIAGWQNEERMKRLSEVAKDIGKKFSSASDRPAVIEKYHLEMIRTATIKHGTRMADTLMLPPMLVADAFGRKPQEGTNAYPAPGGMFMLAVVNSIVPAPSVDSDPKIAEALKNIRKTLETTNENEILQQYAHYLTQRYPVSINEAALEAVQK